MIYLGTGSVSSPCLKYIYVYIYFKSLMSNLVLGNSFANRLTVVVFGSCLTSSSSALTGSYNSNFSLLARP